MSQEQPAQQSDRQSVRQPGWQPTPEQLWAQYEQAAAYTDAKLRTYQRVSALADAKYLEYVRASWERDAAYEKWRKSQNWPDRADTPDLPHAADLVQTTDTGV
jgi:hypothetical protein